MTGWCHWSIYDIKLHNEKFGNLYSSPSTFRRVKRRRLQWLAYTLDGEKTKCLQTVDEETVATWKTGKDTGG
jgi:phosphatidylethanolamine-binding protein (PEBP) family uncharacterized protein